MVFVWFLSCHNLFDNCLGMIDWQWVERIILVFIADSRGSKDIVVFI